MKETIYFHQKISRMHEVLLPGPLYIILQYLEVNTLHFTYEDILIIWLYSECVRSVKASPINNLCVCVFIYIEGRAVSRMVKLPLC